MPGRDSCADRRGLRRRGFWRRQGVLMQTLTAVGVFLTLVTTVAGSPPAASAGTVNSDQAQEAQIQQQIAAQGATIQHLVETYDQAQAKEAQLQAQLDQTRARLEADRTAQAQALARLRRVALTAYVTDDGGSPILTMFDSVNATSLLARQEYTAVASANLKNAIDAFKLDAQKTQSAEAALNAEQAQAEAALQQIASQRQAAQAALDQDNALLSQVQGDLQALLAAQAAQEAAAEKAAEEAMAQRAAAEAAAAAAHPVPITIDPTPGTYDNPLRSISGLVPERIDQGVDYHGYGPVLAVGDGVVLSIVNSGWPGGTFISYRMTDGPANGLVMYAAEDIDPLVKVDQKVTANTVLGTMYEGPDGIETGWADPSGNGYTMARDYGQFSGANSTAFGANYSQMLASLGAPPGVLQNDPPTGSLPPNWPTW